jgi:hypothetical protein
MPKTHQKPLVTTIVNDENKPTLPITVSQRSNGPAAHSILTNKVETVINTNKQALQSIMPSVDIHLVSSTLFAPNIEQHQTAKKRELFTKMEHTLPRQEPQPSEVSTTYSSDPLPIDRNSILDVDSYIPLPDHPPNLRSSPIKSHFDLKIRQSTFQPYERYASASIRSTAINCLQEAGYFKRKSWLKQVEISKEMVKHKVQRRIRRADDDKTTKRLSLLPLHANHTTTPYKTNTIKVN